MTGRPGPARAEAHAPASDSAAPTDRRSSGEGESRAPRTPRVWLLLGEKAGDNAQVRVLAEALGWPCDVRHLHVQPEWRLGKPRVRPSLEPFDAARSDPLEPPWPDLVITTGRRLSMAALWIQQASDGATRLVLLGKPRRLLRRFDLVVASAQYRMPTRANVLRIGLPLMRVDAEAVATAAETWRAPLAALPRPLLALLVGGPTKAVRFDTRVACELAERAARDAEQAGGSLYVCTSRRTTPALVDALAAALPPGARLYRWRADDAANPYRALLGLADRFAVTSDSVTMMIEVARLGRPLAVCRLPPHRRWVRALTRSRDLDAMARMLLAEHYAVALGEPWQGLAAPPGDELPRVVARVRALFDSPPGRSAAPAAAK